MRNAEGQGAADGGAELTPAAAGERGIAVKHKDLMAAWDEAIPKIREHVRGGKTWVVITSSQILAMRLMEKHEQVSGRNSDWAMTPEMDGVDVITNDTVCTKANFPIIGWLFFSMDLFSQEDMIRILREVGVKPQANSFDKKVVALVSPSHVEAVGHILAVCASERQGKIFATTPELN